MRVAVLGQGSIGRRHATNLLELGHEVIAWDPVAEPLDGTSAAESPQSALEAAEAAIIASPSGEHADQARLALDHGCHTLVEKPLALTAAETDPLIALADERQLVLGVAMNLRFHPAVIAVREAVRSGAIGRPLAARAWFGSWLPGWRPASDYRQSYSARRELGGGVLLDAIHEIDYLTWILGPVARVSAALEKVSDLEVNVEDVAQLQLEFASKLQGALSLDYLDRSYDRGCRIIGSEGTVAWSWADGSVVLHDEARSAQETRVPTDADDTYRDEAASFMAAAAGGFAPATPAEDGRHALAVVDAARLSQETHAAVVLDAAIAP